ncbi:MAG: hypothetical protein WBO97_07465 [Tepidiformaceae bacterium]
MRKRFVFAAVPLAILAFSACGDGDGENAADGSPTDAAADATATRPVNEQPQVPDTPLPEPSPVADDVPVIQVGVSGKQYAPLRPEFAALPKTSVTANGKTYEGVSLGALAEAAGAAPGVVATIQGTRMDNLRLGAVRFPLADIASNTVLVMNDSGHISVASSTIPPEQWLKDVTGIGLN